MQELEHWLQPLRDYPRWFVLLCFALAAAAAAYGIAKLLKWGAYAFCAVAFAVATAAFALWLWG